MIRAASCLALARRGMHAEANSSRRARLAASCITGAFVLFCAGPLHADGRLERGIDSETGVVTYSYRPAQKHPALKPEMKVQAEPENAKRNASAAGFPRVPARVKAARDAERHQILLRELADEEEKLARALAEHAGAEAVQRHRANIEALRREIAQIR